MEHYPQGSLADLLSRDGAMPSDVALTMALELADGLRHLHAHGLFHGGLRFLRPGAAEIKRMYVEPAHRGTGLAAVILRDLEARAHDAGVRRLVCETGTLQPEAIRFYQREGYVRIDNFDPYQGSSQSVCLARILGP